MVRLGNDNRIKFLPDASSLWASTVSIRSKISNIAAYYISERVLWAESDIPFRLFITTGLFIAKVKIYLGFRTELLG